MNIESLGISLQEVSMQMEDDSEMVTLRVVIKGPQKRVLRLVDWLGEFCDDESKGSSGDAE